MPVLWRDEMSVGNDMVDKDHRYLFCLINTIELALKSDENKDIVGPTLDQLHFYTKDHFLREETLMLKINYPKYLEQKKMHGMLVAQLDEIRERVNIEAENPDMDSILSDLMALLRNWLLDHVLKEDMQMKHYFKNYHKEFV
jgi:hemerythrin